MSGKYKMNKEKNNKKKLIIFLLALAFVFILSGIMRLIIAKPNLLETKGIKSNYEQYRIFEKDDKKYLTIQINGKNYEIYEGSDVLTLGFNSKTNNFYYSNGKQIMYIKINSKKFSKKTLYNVKNNQNITNGIIHNSELYFTVLENGNHNIYKINLDNKENKSTLVKTKARDLLFNNKTQFYYITDDQSRNLKIFNIKTQKEILIDKGVCDYKFDYEKIIVAKTSKKTCEGEYNILLYDTIGKNSIEIGSGYDFDYDSDYVYYGYKYALMKNSEGMSGVVFKLPSKETIKELKVLDEGVFIIKTTNNTYLLDNRKLYKKDIISHLPKYKIKMLNGNIETISKIYMTS